MADLNANSRSSRTERLLADTAQRREAVLVGNGVTALWSVLTALDLPTGVPVLLPDLTSERAAGAVALAGLAPVFADVRRETAVPSPAELAVAAAASNAGAVVPTHLFGRRGRLPTPDPTCPQIIDATQCDVAPAALAGGIAAVTSFGLGKQLALGGGGAVFTDDPSLAREIRRLQADLSPDHRALLRPAPPWLDARLAVALANHLQARHRRRSHGQLLRESLAAIAGIVPLDHAPDDVPWRITFRVPAHRDAVLLALGRAGFPATRLFAPLHRLAGRPDRDFPRATALASELLNLDPLRLGDEPAAAARRMAAVVAAALNGPYKKVQHAGD